MQKAPDIADKIKFNLKCGCKLTLSYHTYRVVTRKRSDSSGRTKGSWGLDNYLYEQVLVAIYIPAINSYKYESY